MKTYARVAVPAALTAAALVAVTGCGSDDDKPKPVKGTVVAYEKDTCDKDNEHGDFANDYTTNSLHARALTGTSRPVPAKVPAARPGSAAASKKPNTGSSPSRKNSRNSGHGRTCYTEYELTVRTSGGEEIERSVTSDVYELCAQNDKKYPACGAKAKVKK